LAWRYPFRWLSGEGLLPIVILAGFGVEWVAQRLSHAGSGSSRHLLMSVLLAGVLWLSPTLAQRASGWQVLWPDSSPFHLLGSPWVKTKDLDASLVTAHIERLAELVRTHTNPKDILWSNAPYALGCLAAMVRRPMSSAMLNEVGPAQPFDPIAAAHWIVWFKFQTIPGVPSLGELIQRYQLKLVADSEVALVYRNPTAVQTARSPHAVIPWWMAFVLSCGFFGLALWDFRRAAKSTVEPHA
jgi:hypothetical protein